MTKFPELKIILAGFLAQISLRLLFYIEELEVDSESRNNLVALCESDRILWLALILISVGEAILITWKNKENKYKRGAITFLVSFLLNLAGDNLGYLAAACTADNFGSDFNNIYSGISLAISIIACIGISACLYKKWSPPKPTRFPDPDVLLLGLCAHFAFWHFVSLQGKGNKSDYDCYCDNKALRSWIQLLALSFILALIASGRGMRSAFSTFLASFLLHLIVGGTGKLVILCTFGASTEMYFWNSTETYSGDAYPSSGRTPGRIYSNVTMISLGFLALGITVCSLKKKSGNSPDQTAINNEAAENPVQEVNLVQAENPVQEVNLVQAENPVQNENPIQLQDITAA